MGDGWVMNQVGDVGDKKVRVSMDWSPPVDIKLGMICGLSIGMTADLQDVNLDDENSYKVKLKFGFMDNYDDGKRRKKKMEDGILLEGNDILKDLIVDNKFSVKAEVMILPVDR